jgi:hypothetical protein
MHVELVVPEPERNAILAVVFDRHAQHARVKIQAAVKVGRRQYYMVEGADHLVKRREW